MLTMTVPDQSRKLLTGMLNCFAAAAAWVGAEGALDAAEGSTAGAKLIASGSTLARWLRGVTGFFFFFISPHTARTPGGAHTSIGQAQLIRFHTPYIPGQRKS